MAPRRFPYDPYRSLDSIQLRGNLALPEALAVFLCGYCSNYARLAERRRLGETPI